MKLSIITPSFNQGQFIRKTFESILNQNINFELEYILVDAVSTDETSKIVKEFTPKFKAKNIDFKFICEKDNGQSDAINKGWKMATGDIITYLNSDDFYEPNVLQSVMNYFQNNPKIKWAYGGWKLIDQNKNVFLINQPKKYIKKSLLFYCNIGQSSCFFRKEMLDELGYLDIDLHLSMDYDLWLRFATKYPAGIIDNILSNMRYHKDAKSMKFTQKQLFENYKIGAKYTRPISWARTMQIFYLIRGLMANFLKISKIQKGLR